MSVDQGGSGVHAVSAVVLNVDASGVRVVDSVIWCVVGRVVGVVFPQARAVRGGGAARYQWIEGSSISTTRKGGTQQKRAEADTGPVL